ncbi:MAG: hypothetical protein GYA36_22945 [Veillonellaceae bacterium]|nr:hypothetical protein [Veillonellaceae bacterium]
MATRFVTRETILQKAEGTAARLVLYYEAGTAEEATVTVSKGGGAFGATAGSAVAQVTGTCYKLTVHADDVDTVGEVAFCLTGATDTTYLVGVRVVEHDPWDLVAAVLGALVATYKATTGSVADLLNRVYRVVGFGCRKADTSDNTIKVYDGDTDAAALIGTQTKSEVGTVTTLTPS